MKKKQQRRKRNIIQKPRIQYKKYFAEGEKPSYKKWEALSNFITDRGKILPRTSTGLSSKMQRRLTREIQRARHLAFLPFTVKPL